MKNLIKSIVLPEKINQQYYLIISHAGSMCSDKSKSEISDQDMILSKVVKRVLNAALGYGFYYEKKEYTIVNNTKFFSEKCETAPFNFIDPVEIYLSNGEPVVKIRNSWAAYHCDKKDNIIFSSVEKKKAFKSSYEHSLNIITG